MDEFPELPDLSPVLAAVEADFKNLTLRGHKDL